MKKEFKQSDICQSAHVTRWHSRNCHRYPSIAEHSFLVTMMAARFYRQVILKTKESEELALLKYSLWHDMPEVVTGDLPTPIKVWIKKWISQHLDDGAHDPLEELEITISSEYAETLRVIRSLPPEIYLIFKIADVAEAYRFINEEGKGIQGRSIAGERKDKIHFLLDQLEKAMSIRWQDMGDEERKAEKSHFKNGCSAFLSEIDIQTVIELDELELR